mmetsp:Transcript_74702/g.177768  ORF Transcript_74702/g.177768 Transcript_74702/m.177768 type:complete len:97 (+) Transcript_74702:203-493(+)
MSKCTCCTKWLYRHENQSGKVLPPPETNLDNSRSLQFQADAKAVRGRRRSWCPRGPRTVFTVKTIPNNRNNVERPVSSHAVMTAMSATQCIALPMK